MACLASWRLSAKALMLRCNHTTRIVPFLPTCRQCSGYSKERQTHFGFQSVQEDVKKEKVLGVFHAVADSYDLMNDAMSAGVHRVWKDYFIAQMDPGPDTKLLDVAGGTGDIAFRFMNKVGKEALSSEDGASVVVCDINKSMLQVGESRAAGLGHTSGISWVEGDAQKLPFPDASFDCYTVAFGIRNVVRVEEALAEAYRVLKPGGRFMCLEFSKVTTPGLDSLYDFYSFQIIPPMGKVLAGDWDSYQYLVESIRQFPPQEEFAQMIKDAGFRFVDFENLTFGVAAISEFLEPIESLAPIMDSVRQRRKEEAAATRERISEIRKRMKASETWQSRVNRVLALLYPFLLLLALGLGAYCCYKYATIYMDSWDHEIKERESDKINVESDILEVVDNDGVEEILAEEE